MSHTLLVKLEMPIDDVLPFCCYRQKLQNLSRIICGLQICQIWIQLITDVTDITENILVSFFPDTVYILYTDTELGMKVSKIITKYLTGRMSAEW